MSNAICFTHANLVVLSPEQFDTTKLQAVNDLDHTRLFHDLLTDEWALEANYSTWRDFTYFLRTYVVPAARPQPPHQHVAFHFEPCFEESDGFKRPFRLVCKMTTDWDDILHNYAYRP